MSLDDLHDMSMEELFRAEAETQCAVLTGDLLALEKSENPAPLLENLMRAAHSLKGAARIVGLDKAVSVAHAMEDRFVEAQKTNAVPGAAMMDVMLKGVDLLRQIAGLAKGAPSDGEIEEFAEACKNAVFDFSQKAPASPSASVEQETQEEVIERRRDVRLDSARLDNLLGLAGQAVVASRQKDNGFDMLRIALRHLQASLAEASSDASRQQEVLRQASVSLLRARSLLAELAESRDVAERRLARLCSRIYDETLACRLRPFGDIVPGLHRMARDLARQLGKEVRFEISGESAEVDRDILDRLDGPLSHLIRNALDHGVEAPDVREAAGKQREGVLEISARHHAGWLVVAISDDGRGPSFDAIKSAVVSRGFAAENLVAQMSEAELLEFLLLPGFSLRGKVTEISGRGVGLDAVRAMAHGAGGSLRIGRSQTGGFLCEIILPVSLSLVRALIVEIGDDYFAIPLSRVERVLHVEASEIHAVAGRQHILTENGRVEILSAARVMDLEEGPAATPVRPVVIMSGAQGSIGLSFDKLTGQRELSLQRLDSWLGRMQDVSATALLENGDPVVVLDADDLAVTAAHFSSGSRYRPLEAADRSASSSTKRILVADDSLTVRELERKLLASRGYAVETAVDGADAWHALRASSFDLLVTDIDMPRLDGIELVKMVRADPRLRDVPVVVVSYKDREEDRARGLEAGADFYLPKSSYQDESLLNAVKELIGDPITS